MKWFQDRLKLAKEKGRMMDGFINKSGRVYQPEEKKQNKNEKYISAVFEKKSV